MPEAATLEAPAQAEAAPSAPTTEAAPVVTDTSKPVLPMPTGVTAPTGKNEDEVWAALTGDTGEASEVDKLFDAAKGDKPEQAADEKKPEAKADDAKKADEPAADSEETRQRREKVVRAKVALAKDNWTNEEIEALDTKSLLDRFERIRKRQDTADEAFNKLKAGGSTKASPNHSAGRSGSESSDGAAVQSTSEDQEEHQPSTSIDQHLEVVKQYDPELSTKIARAQKAHETKVSQAAEARIAQAQQSAFSTRVAYAKDKLVGQFPGLATKDSLKSVLEFMGSIDTKGELAFDDDPAGFVELMKKSCWAKFGEQIGQQTRQALLTENARTRNGQPSISTVSPKPATLTPAQIEDFKFKAAAEANGDDAKYKAILSRAGIK